MAAGKHSHDLIDQFVNEHPAVAIKTRASTMRGKYHYRTAETIPQYEARLAAQVPWKSGQPLPGGGGEHFLNLNSNFYKSPLNYRNFPLHFPKIPLNVPLRISWPTPRQIQYYAM